LWIDENRLTDDAGTTSVTPPGWFINRFYTVIPRTVMWISFRTVLHAVANFSGLNIDNLTNRTFIYSEVLISWISSSTTMKRVRPILCMYTCNKNTNNLTSYITGWAVAQTCCISQCAKYRKSGIFGYPWEQNP